MFEPQGDKTHDPTPQRLTKARQQGQVARSQDLVSAVILCGGCLLLLYWAGSAAGQLMQYTSEQLGGAAWLSIDQELLLSHWGELARLLLWMLLPFLLGIAVLAVLVNLGQTGFLFLPEKLQPDFSRIDPIQGLGRIFSLTNVGKLGFGFTQFLLISSLAAVLLYSQRDALLEAMSYELPAMGVFLAETVLWTSLKVAAALLILAVADYLFQRWKLHRSLMMTTQELREEAKEQGANPLVLARRQELRRQMSAAQLVQLIPQANLILTGANETALALKYDETSMAAPVVVAKGERLIAQRICRLAADAQVPVQAAEFLTPVQFRQLVVNQPISGTLYREVAAAFAQMYQKQSQDKR